MKVKTSVEGREQEIIDLFKASFAASEGAEEGMLIGDLARDLLDHTKAEDIRIFTAEEAGELIGAVIFSRLIYPEDSRCVFLLSPLAVAPGQQRKGVGQTLVSQSLSALFREGVDVVMTYGDPAFYGRVGFTSIAEALASPPLPLTYPHGWLGQTAKGTEMGALNGPSHCVSALNRPDIW